MKKEKAKKEKEIDILDEVYEPRLAPPPPPPPPTVEEKRSRILEMKCDFSDDWNVVLAPDLETRIAHIIKRESIRDIIFANNYLIGHETGDRGDFIAFNPIFLHDTETCGATTLDFESAKTESENHEIVFPNAYSALCFSRPA